MRETGVGIQNPLFFIGVVENNIDSRLEGRIQVRAFGIHGTVSQIPTEELPWATIISGAYDPDVSVPPLNSWVFGFFVDGRDAQQPMILGLIPTQMTQPVDPERYGWGVIPPRDNDILARGSRPQDYGQPAQSRLARGENIEETYVLAQEMNRITDVPIAGVAEADNETSFDEPASAYNAQYPFNRVIETAGGHSIEIDDTPGAERIMIYHKSGSYTQIDSNGTKVDKSISDKYEIDDANQHVYVGGKSIVTIEGDARVLVKGNKIEEITGDYTQLVHGNHMISVGGQMNLNASDEIQARAGRMRLESNVQDFSVKSTGNLFTQASGSVNIKSDHVKIGGGSQVSLSADVVAADEIIQLANGDSSAPSDAQGADLPEPTPKSTSTTKHKNTSSIGSSGYASLDEGEITQSENQPLDVADLTGNNSTALAKLRDFISEGEGGYSAVNRGTIGNRIVGSVNDNARRNGKLIENLTFRELFELQQISDPNNPNRVFAVGRYQIIPDTMREIFPYSGLSLDDTFSTTNQDILGNLLLLGSPQENYYKRPTLSKYLRGENNNLQAAMIDFAKEWASIPDPRTGRSVYGGGNVAKNTTTEIVSSVLIDARREVSGVS